MDLLGFLFPRRCLECQKGEEYLCPRCLRNVSSPRPILAESSILGVNVLYSVWTYEGVVRKAIIGLKYQFARDIARKLAEKSLPFLRKMRFPENVVLVPVPLSSSRGRWRGFNQAEEVGKLIARGMGWDYKPGLISKTKTTRPQAELKGQARKTNLRGTFKLRTQALTQKGTIVLFDDVWTTGSTLKEAARTLKEKSQRPVWGLTLARVRWGRDSNSRIA